MAIPIRIPTALLLALLLASCGSDADAPKRRIAGEADAHANADASAADDAESGQAAGKASRDPATNAPPTIRSLAFEPERPITGGDVRVVVEVDDPDGDRVWLDYAWQVGGEPVEGSTPRLSLRGVPKRTRIEVDVTARDGRDGRSSETLRADVANAVPVVGRVHVHGAESPTVGEPVLLQPEATDADGDPLSFRYQWSVNGVRQAEDGERFDTGNLNRGDVLEVSVRAHDGAAESETFALPPITLGNAPPRILSQPGEDFGSGDSFYQVRAEDPDGPGPLHYALENAPEGMRIDPETGAIRWTPRPDQAGVHALAVLVSDVQGGTSRQPIEVTVGGGSPAEAAPPASRR